MILKDASAAFRKSVWEALEGNLTAAFDGSNSQVAVYDGQVTSQNDGLYVLLSTEQSNDISNKSENASEISLLLEITHRPDFAIDSRVLDDISNQVMAILKPDVPTNGIAEPSDFQYIGFQVQSGNKLNLTISSTNSIHRKLLTLSCRAYQLN
jgi:hypothetical protein